MNPTSFCTVLVAAGLTAFAQAPAPQRTIMENRVTHGKSTESKTQADQPAPASGQTIDSLLNSTEDLNAIRDGYVRRLAGDGCRPDVAIRVAELRSRLDETASRRGQAQNTAAVDASSAELEGSLLILAAGWFQTGAATAPARANREPERAQLLDFVLSPKEPETRAAASGANAAQLKDELDRLLATCRNAGH
jgi:hypothetical protein